MPLLQGGISLNEPLQAYCIVPFDIDINADFGAASCRFVNPSCLPLPALAPKVAHPSPPSPKAIAPQLQEKRAADAKVRIA